MSLEERADQEKRRALVKAGLDPANAGVERRELAVLKCVLDDPASLERSALDPSAFRLPWTRLLFAAALELRGAGRDVTGHALVVTAAARLRADRPGEPDRTEELQHVVRAVRMSLASVKDLPALAGQIRAAVELVRMREVLRWAEEQAFRETYPPEALAAEVAGRLKSCLRTRLREPATAQQLVGRRVDQLLRAISAPDPGAPPPRAGRIKTGLRDLDARITGVPRGTSTVVAARQGVGKTSFVLHLGFATHEPVLVFCFEELTRDVADRLIARQTGLDASWLGGLDPSSEVSRSDLATLTGVQARTPTNVRFVDARGMSFADIAREARAQAEAPAMIIVDYLNRVRRNRLGRGQRGDEAIREGLCELDDVAKELDAAMVIGAQLKRAAEEENRDPRMADIAEADAIGWVVKLGLLLKRPRRGDADDEAHVLIDKQNVGQAGRRVVLGWHGPTMTYSNRLVP